jgi:hypothetical protein
MEIPFRQMRHFGQKDDICVTNVIFLVRDVLRLRSKLIARLHLDFPEEKPFGSLLFATAVCNFCFGVAVLLQAKDPDPFSFQLSVKA